MAKHHESGSPQVMPKQSGYAGGVADWKRFLRCWQHSFTPPPDTDIQSVLQGEVRPEDSDETAILEELARTEKRLGIKLPASYRDFMLAFAAMPRPESLENTDHVGLFRASQIGRVADLAPMSVKFAEESPIMTPDEEYFVYGIDQDYTSGRYTYVKNALLVGKHGPSMLQEIVLHPQLLTQDGEMEAAINFWGGQFRAPSFAELMRQLSYAETRSPDAGQPYAQGQLRSSCADLLPMRNVWWR